MCTLPFYVQYAICINFETWIYPCTFYCYSIFRAMFSKRPEICPLVRKLLKICIGWVNPDATEAYGQYGDELKIKKPVLMKSYPKMCSTLDLIFGEMEPMIVANMTCSELKRSLFESNSSREVFEQLYLYARDNLLWLNVYIKDSFATRIIRDERMTRTSFVANVGGLLGLCMGFSLVSAAEIMYFCCKRKHSFDGVFNRFLKKRRKNVNGNDHRRNSSNVGSRFSQQQESQSLNFDHVEAHMSVDMDDEAESAWNIADTKLYWQVAFRMYLSYFITSFIDMAWMRYDPSQLLYSLRF